MQSYYVDSCIYLNLWQKETNLNTGEELWRHAQEFFEKIDQKQEIIYYSGFLLKELMFILTIEEYLQKVELFENSQNFKKVILSREEFNLATEIKKKNQEISLYDIIHILLAKKTNSILITRDKLLTNLAKEFSVIVKRPEEVL
jgi:predicted nucleic acid-binding protein